MYASQILAVFILTLAASASPLLPRVDRSHDGIYGEGGKIAEQDGTPVDRNGVVRVGHSGDGIYGAGGQTVNLDGTPADENRAGRVDRSGDGIYRAGGKLANLDGTRGR
jgi:hypothetical protein